MPESLAISPVLITLVIFSARVLDVSIGTVRTILVVRGKTFIAATLGFFETLIWLVASASVIQNLDAWYLAVAYAAGFAAGNIVGMRIEAWLAMGDELVRVVSANRAVSLSKVLHQSGYKVTELLGAMDGKTVEVMLIVEKRRRVRRLVEAIRAADPEAIWTVSDVKSPHHEGAQRRWIPGTLFSAVKRK